jgi:hypothetical protein
MIIIDTVRDHFERGYWLSCWCAKCKGFVDCCHQRLMMRGKPDKPLSEIRIKHACGSIVDIRRIPPYGPQIRAGRTSPSARRCGKEGSAGGRRPRGRRAAADLILRQHKNGTS